MLRELKITEIALLPYSFAKPLQIRLRLPTWSDVLKICRQKIAIFQYIKKKVLEDKTSKTMYHNQQTNKHTHTHSRVHVFQPDLWEEIIPSGTIVIS